MSFVLDPAKPSELQNFLRRRGLLAADRQLARLERPGEGNMNLTLRACFDDGRTLIVKQSRAWVEKYPTIAAPETRILSEIAFYRAVAAEPGLARRMPALVYYSARDRIACFEDLGPAADLTGVYRGEPLAGDTERDLLQWLAQLHALKLDPNDWGEVLQNRAMRVLNHAHIFEIPFSGDGAPELDAVTPGLADIARRLRSDLTLRSRARDLGNRYLARGERLVHGDFYPGSWLAHRRGVRIIDPEFAFFGLPEFDVGVYLAHRIFGGGERADLDRALARYEPPAGFDATLALAFAGIEILRRLLGVAQLPLVADLERKRTWLALARDLALGLS